MVGAGGHQLIHTERGWRKLRLEPPGCRSDYLPFLNSVYTVVMDSRAALPKALGGTMVFRVAASGKMDLSCATSGASKATLALLAVG